MSNDPIQIMKFGDESKAKISLDLNFFEGDHNYQIYQLENQINGIFGVYVFDNNKNPRGAIFGHLYTNQHMLVPDTLEDIYISLLNVIEGNPVDLFTTRGENIIRTNQTLSDNDVFYIYFRYPKKRNELVNVNDDMERMPVKELSLAKFKEFLLMDMAEGFYRKNAESLVKIMNKLKITTNTIEEFYGDNKLIGEFRPAILSPRLEAFENNLRNQNNVGTPGILSFISGMLNIVKGNEQFEIIEEIIRAKTGFWDYLIDQNRINDNTSHSMMTGSFFNVNNIWHGKKDKTETSKTWDIIDSIGIVMMRLLPIILLIIIVVIIIMIIITNKNKCGCNK